MRQVRLAIPPLMPDDLTHQAATAYYDGLDRVRLDGDAAFDARNLRTPYLQGEEARARQLWQASAPGQPGAPWARVRTAAAALGLWP